MSDKKFTQIVQFLYRDGGNYKSYATFRVHTDQLLEVGDEVLMEELGWEPEGWCREYHNGYDPEFDHNILEVTGTGFEPEWPGHWEGVPAEIQEAVEYNEIKGADPQDTIKALRGDITFAITTPDGDMLKAEVDSGMVTECHSDSDYHKAIVQFDVGEYTAWCGREIEVGDTIDIRLLGYWSGDLTGDKPDWPYQHADKEFRRDAELDKEYSATFNINVYANSNWENFDAVEVHGCKNVELRPIPEDAHSEGTAVEQCEDWEAEFWSVYLHRTGEGLECVADARTREIAEDFAKVIEALRPTAYGEWIILENLGSSEYVKPVTNEDGGNMVFDQYIDAAQYAEKNVNGAIIVAI